ncbi:MAG TPA: cation-translocating P-type ATPase [Gemmatimonadales bacterium]|nr:cation-translocating P-type ATPase [Gemmatimonadales bacterium]
MMTSLAGTTPWHALAPADALARLDASPRGLTEAEAARRLERYGPNRFRRAPPVSAWRILLTQLRSVIVLLLVVAALVALATGDPLDAAAIGAVLVLNVALGFVTELRAHRAMEALLGLEVARATVLRDGSVRDLDARHVVPGDVLLLEAGMAVAADARLLETAELRTVEAPLTGESLPVDKRTDAALEPDTPAAERSTMVYKATTVVAGRGRAVVVGTGMDTEVGRIGALTESVQEEPTPLERRLDSLGRRLAGLAIGVAVLVTVLGLLQGAALGELVQTAIALAVAAVPEGLPVVGTIAMAVGVRRMARRSALIRHLPVVETLGSATVICTDKTGTLTAGEMTVTELRLPDLAVSVPEGEFTPTAEVLRLLRTACLANRATLSQENGAWRTRGDPTETALLVAGRKAGLDPARLRAEWSELAELPFSSERMFMATWHQAPSGLVVCVKGAPHRVLELCSNYREADRRQPLDAAARERFLAANSELAGRGLRVLAVAGSAATRVGDPPKELTWLGIVGMMDPPAPGVAETIRVFRQAGIRTLMITGDQGLTARSVAERLGVVDHGGRVRDGREVDHLTDEVLRQEVGDTSVFSRVSPEAKLRIVGACQARGDVVAMLGDGVNDAAALRKADIGVAMGRRGTDLAKEAADLVLADDRFTTIGAAVEQGRVIFDNIRKFVFYLFSCNLAEILVFLGAGLGGHAAPLLPLQILWLNLVTDTFPALALAVEPGDPAVMRQPPRDPREAILSARMLRAIAIYGALIAAVTIAAYYLSGTTAAFMTLALAQILHLGNARSADPVLAPRLAFANRAAVGAVLLAAGLQILTVLLEPLTRVLRVTPLTGREWVLVVGLGALPALLGQGVKVGRSLGAKGSG